MKLLHCCPTIYMDGYGYQDQFLSMQNKKDGHEVLVVASTYIFNNNDNDSFKYTAQREYINADGILVKRREYVCFFGRKISEKIRKLKGLYEIMIEFAPDVIFFEGTSSVDIGTVAQYKKDHPHVKYYICSHTDFYTSGRNWLSRKILHGLIYKYYLQKAVPLVDKYFYITLSCKEFYEKIYKIPAEKMECLPLGGVIPDESELLISRGKVEREFDIAKDSIIFLQAGKMNKRKKLVEMLEVFSSVQDKRFVFIIAGSLSEDIRESAEEVIGKDSRIHYVGWQSIENLNIYLNACDVYLQPGKVSATLQNAICRGCAIVSNFFIDYQPYVNENGWLTKDILEMKSVLELIANGEVDIDLMKRKSMEIGRECLDYKKIARRLYET